MRAVDGGTRLAKTRHNLQAAGLTPAEWRKNWECARYRIQANGSGDEPFGNITITPAGDISLRLPKPLECLANAKRGRYVLSGTAKFSYRPDEWRARITDGKSASYTITRKPSWPLSDSGMGLSTRSVRRQLRISDGDVRADGTVVAVDLNKATRRSDGKV